MDFVSHNPQKLEVILELCESRMQFELGVQVMYFGTTLEANKSEAVTLQAPNLIRTEKCVIWYLSYQVNGTNILPGSRY